MTGKVISTKMQRTLIVQREYLHYVKKYNRYEKRHKNIPTHCSPCFKVKQGDFVTIGECRHIITINNLIFQYSINNINAFIFFYYYYILDINYLLYKNDILIIL